ncbi:MAG: VWA domain-containing protein [Anaerolineales bacterium]|nr:VWA domain-containing protein [Anaerolineales bacterium]
MNSIACHKKSLQYLLVFAILASVLLPLPVGAQAPSIDFQIQEIRNDTFPVLDVFVSVTDTQGFPVDGLDKSNFSLSENGAPVDDFTVVPQNNIGQPLDFVLAIDTSGSMDTAAAPTPLDDAVRAAKNFVALLQPADRVAVVAFSSQVTLVQDLTTDRTLITQALDGLQPEGNTAFYDAIVRSVDVLKNSSQRKVIIILSDGTDSGIGEYTLSEAIDEAVRWNIPVYPIAFGTLIDQDELGKIADRTGGQAQIKPDSSALIDSYRLVLEILRQQYKITYTSALLADGSENELAVQVSFGGWSQNASQRFIAQPGVVTVSLPDYSDGQVIGGQLVFAPEIISPGRIERLEILIDGSKLETVVSAPFEYAWDSKSVSPGDHLFTFIVSDQSGNQGEISVTLNVQPAITVSLESPAAGDALSVPTQVSASVSSLAALASVEFLIDGASQQVMQVAPFTFDWNVPNSSFGEHTIEVIATDVQGNQASDQVSVQTRAPIEIVISSPSAGDELKVDTMIVAEIDAPFGISQVVVSAAGTPLLTDTAKTIDLKWNLLGIRAGQYPIRIDVTDTLGHVASEEIMVTVTEPGGTGGPQTSDFLWVTLILVLALAAILIPLALRRRKAGAHAQAAGLLRELQGRNPGQVWPLAGEEIHLGRLQRENDIPLQGTTASRNMALIHWQDGHYLVYSLVPENPVIVNDQPVAQQVVLQPGDQLRLGESVFVFEAGK